MTKYNFDNVPNRWNYYERRFDKNYNLKEFNIESDDVLNFGIADINFESPAPIIDAIKARVDKKTFSYSYVSDDTIAAIRKWYLDWHNIDLKDHYIKIVHGTVNAMYQVVQEFTNENDYVLLFTPIYQPFSKAILINNRKIVGHKLKLNHQKMRYEIDFVKLEKQIKDFKIKLLFLCNPHNPSSQVWTKEELRALKDISEKYNLVVFSDEVHSEIVYQPFTSFLTMNYDQTILGNSPNKAFGVGGLKSSYLITKNYQLLKQIEKRYEKNSITTPNIFINTILQVISLNNVIKEWLKQFAEYMNSNFQYLKNELEKLNIQVFNLESTYLVWAKIPVSSVWLFNQLKEQKIIVSYANDFYDCQDNFIRINIATSKKQLEILVQALNIVMTKKD